MGRREPEYERKEEEEYAEEAEEEEGGESLDEDEYAASKGEGESGDSESDDELQQEQLASLRADVEGGNPRLDSYNEDGDSDSDDAPEEFTLTQGRERVSQQRQQEAEARRMVAKAVKETRQKRAGLADKGDEGARGGEEEGEKEGEGEGEERREKEKRKKDKRRKELEDRAERRKRRRGEEGGGEETAEALREREKEGEARVLGGEGEREGGRGELDGGVVDGGIDLLPDDVIAAVTRRQHTRFVEEQQERALKAGQRAQLAGKSKKGKSASAVIGRRSDGAIVVQAGAPAPEGAEAARAIMRAAQSFRHGLLFGRRHRSLEVLGFIDPKGLKVAGQWRPDKHLGEAGTQMGKGKKGGKSGKKGGGRRVKKATGRGGSSRNPR